MDRRSFFRTVAASAAATLAGTAASGSAHPLSPEGKDVAARWGSVSKSFEDLVANEVSSNPSIASLPTGFADLDYLTGGLRRGYVVAIAGRPALGKSTLALNIATHLAAERDVPVAYFSAPRPSDGAISDVLSARSGHDRALTRRATLNLEPIRIPLLQALPLAVDDTPLLTFDEIRCRLDRLRDEVGKSPSMVVIDRLDMLRVGSSDSTDHDRMVEVAGELQAVAHDFDAAVLVTLDVGRRVQRRRDKRPRISDLAHAMTPIVRAADLLLLIYRDEIYNPDSLDAGRAEIEVALNRHGRTGIVALGFRGSCARFEDVCRF